MNRAGKRRTRTGSQACYRRCGEFVVWASGPAARPELCGVAPERPEAGDLSAGSVADTELLAVVGRPFGIVSDGDRVVGAGDVGGALGVGYECQPADSVTAGALAGDVSSEESGRAEVEPVDGAVGGGQDVEGPAVGGGDRLREVGKV